MLSLVPVLILFLTLVSLTTSTITSRPLHRSQKQTPLPQKQSPGVYANEIFGAKIYEALGALTFEFRLPSHPPNETSMVFDYDCPDANFTTDYSCPVFHHLHKFRDDLLTIINPHRLLPESTPNPFHIPSCHELSRHFTSTTSSPSKLKKYQSLLTTCLDGLVVKSPLSLLHSEGPTGKTYFTSMVQGFVENYYKFLPSTGRLDKAVLLNAITINNALGLTKLLQDAQTFQNGWTDCQNSDIPTHFVPPKVLRPALENLTRLLSEKELELVIPGSNDAISEYYKIRGLTDCVMTPKSLFVRILVPVKKEETDWRLFSLQSLPFIYNDGEDKSQLVCTVKDFDGNLYSFDSRSNRSFRLRDCDLKETALCHNGENPSSFMQNSRKTCASEILANQSKDDSSGQDNSMVDPQLNKICDLNCEPSHLFRMPIILRVAADRIYVAGQVTQSISLDCQGSRMQRFEPPVEGALELRIPCGCKVLAGSLKLVGMEPCGRNLTVTIVRPVHLAALPKPVEEDEVEMLTPEPEKEPRRLGWRRNSGSGESDED